MKAWIDTMMTRAIACLFVLGLAADTAAPPEAEDSAAWNACLAAPGRACVLRAAAEVARAIPARNNDLDEPASSAGSPTHSQRQA